MGEHKEVMVTVGDRRDYAIYKRNPRRDLEK